MKSMPPSFLHSTHNSNFNSLFIHRSTRAERAQEASGVWEALSLLWTCSADPDSPCVLSEPSGRSSECHLTQSSAAEHEPCASCPSPATREPWVHQPIAPWNPSRQGRVCSHTVQPSRPEGLVPNHLLGRGPSKLLNRAWEGFGRVLIGRGRAVQCAKHSTARRSQCQCPGMFPGCIGLDGASLCKSHCNKQIPLPKPNSSATKEHLLVRLGIQKSTVNFTGV